jgi:small subunit ribosomal protein S11
MGKKKIIQKTEEELVKEVEVVEGALRKEPEIKIPSVKKISEGKIYISSTFNNTIITLTDNAGNVLTWTSAGRIGFKGAKKSTPYAASKVSEALVQAAKKMGIDKVQVLIKGVGSGRESALRSLATHGLNITSIKDITPIPHGGVRPPKPRRV